MEKMGPPNYSAIQKTVLLENRVSRGLPVSETKTTKYIKKYEHGTLKSSK